METAIKKRMDLCEFFGIEENQEIDLNSKTDSVAIGNPYYIRGNDIYDCTDTVCDHVMLKLLKGEYSYEPVINHLKEGRWYFFCYLPESYSKVDQIKFDKFDDTCALNVAIGNLFVREELAKANMDKVRAKLDAVRNAKAFIGEVE